MSCRILPSVHCWPASEDAAAWKEICSWDIKSEIFTCIPLDTNIGFVIRLSEQLPDSKNDLQNLTQNPRQGFILDVLSCLCEVQCEEGRWDCVKLPSLFGLLTWAMRQSSQKPLENY